MTATKLFACVLGFMVTLGESPASLGRVDRLHPGWLIPAYSASRVLVGGCTPILQKFEDGSIAWKGCPTFTCPGDECQAEFSQEDTLGRCKCLEGGMRGVQCEGVVVLDQWGIPVDWDCFRQECLNDCTRQQAPAGAGTFAVCDC